MKNSKILIRINSLDEIEIYQKNGINNFIFALEYFSIGYPSFSIEQLNNIKGNIYLLINRIFDSVLIEDFKNVIPKLKFIKGIFFEDLGIYNLLKNNDIPLIWDQFHFVVNSVSINFWLNRVHSVNLSSDLTLREIQYILNKVKKKIILPVLGNNMAMYSRRYLLKSYTTHKNFKYNNQVILNTGNNNLFKVIETEHGTVLFYNKIFNYLNYLKDLNDDKILFYYLNVLDLSADDILAIIKGKKILSEEKFLHHKTISKLGSIKND